MYSGLGLARAKIGNQRGYMPKNKGGFSMKKQEIERLDMLRKQGKKVSKIAKTLQISLNTVRSYMRRYPIEDDNHRCKNCDKPIYQPPGRKPKLFCSDKCRMTWWNSHRNAVNKKSIPHVQVRVLRKGVFELCN
jgi:hypothetical protein